VTAENEVLPTRDAAGRLLLGLAVGGDARAIRALGLLGDSGLGDPRWWPTMVQARVAGAVKAMLNRAETIDCLTVSEEVARIVPKPHDGDTAFVCQICELAAKSVPTDPSRRLAVIEECLRELRT